MSSDRSIRSFALDYYRKRGAEIRQLDDPETFEIQPPQAAKLTVTFAEEAESPLTSTSPQWRAILEDLTADLAVSYRYLTTGAIAFPARTLEAFLPVGWQVRQAKLRHVDNRNAIGFTHRVTFDSPALNACREVIHHHVWDVQDERRLPQVEPRLYDLPCLLIRPENLPQESTVQGLLGRSLAVVDEASDARGREIERELATLLEDAEKRTNQYFEQQMGNVIQREVNLTQKLDAARRRLMDARTRETVIRYRQDAEALERQLEQVCANRNAELSAVESACQARLKQERDRHELTATTDLVALCHVRYDVLTYRIEFETPEGASAAWDVEYCPITGLLRLPACPVCSAEMKEPVALVGLGKSETPGDDAALAFACDACVQTCGSCGERSLGFTGGACSVCRIDTCSCCVTQCTQCERGACRDHVVACVTCQADLCGDCVKGCSVCNEPVCQAHAQLDPRSGRMVCPVHVAQFDFAALSRTPATPDIFAQDPQMPASDPLMWELPSVTIVPARDQASETTASPSAEIPVPVAVAQRVDTAPRAVEAPAPELEELQLKPDPIFSVISGRPLHPKLAEVCPCCEGHFAVQEMVDCTTCGTPSCLNCHTGELGPCPACNALEPAGADDLRLEFVYAQFPELKNKRRRWEIAVHGPYVLTHWSRLGTWGMVVYHRVDACIMTAFEYGRFDTFKQSIKGWWGSDS